MAVDVLMPNLGFDTQSGRLIEWLKQAGDSVAKGEPIAVIESDKANVELEALAAGILLEHLVQAGEEVNVGAVLARIGPADEFRPAPPNKFVPTAPPPTDAPQRISPLAKRIAQNFKLDVEQMTGSGMHGRVTRRDVEAAHRTRSVWGGTIPANGADARGIKALPVVRSEARQRGIDLADVIAAGIENPITLATLETYQQAQESAPSPSAGLLPAFREAENNAPIQQGARIIPLSRMRQTIGRRLSESMREAPHFYVTGEFDFERALNKLETLTLPAKINDLLLYVTAQTLLQVPALNRNFDKGTLTEFDAVNLAIAVAREDGLITPVLRHADSLSLRGIASESRALIARARENRLSVDDLQGGTFTVSNMGMIMEVDHFTAVINPPQVGILAIGALKPRPVVMDGGLHIRHTARLTLSGDHRVVDGMDLARFMQTFQQELERFSV